MICAVTPPRKYESSPNFGNHIFTESTSQKQPAERTTACDYEITRSPETVD